MSLASDLIDQVRAALNTIGRARAATAAAREQAVEIHAEVTIATDGSSDERPAEARLRLEYAQIKLDEATAEFAAAAEAGEAYIAAVGGGGSPASGPPTPPTPAAEPPRRGIPGFTHRRPVPEAEAAIRREGWPKNRNGNISARGHLYDQRGVPVNDTVIRPHVKGEAPPCDELREPWRSDPDITTTWHAERDAAKMMRDKQMRYAVLYLNVPTCGKESGNPRRCDANLEKILPRDAELHVWSIHEDGSKARRRYEGTGEAIR